MARSNHSGYKYMCEGSDPRAGKLEASRRLRRGARQAVRGERLALDRDTPAPDRQDRTRGNAGSKDMDRGWRYFGDGKL